MRVGTTFYLSRVIGNKLYSERDEVVGRLLDIVVDLASIRPRALALKVKIQNEIRYIDFSTVSITKVETQYKIRCQSVIDVERQDGTLLLVKDVLDKQIVDMYGRKVVRVNDLRLVVLSNGTYLVAVDVGFEGFLRRLGVAKPLKRIMRPMQINISSNLLLWDEVETIDFSKRGIKLSKTYTKLSTMHPSDLADIIEDLDRTTQLEIFSSLDDEKAADVLEELDTEAQINVLDSLTADAAAQMLEKLPVDEVADILDELEDERANEILQAMELETSNEIRELMEYPEDSVGSLMTTEFIALEDERTVADVLIRLRAEEPEADNATYMYVIDKGGRLQGSLSLRDVVLALPETELAELIHKDVIFAHDDEDIEDLTSVMSKYNLTSIPVVDRNKELVGMVILSDVLDVLLKSRKRRA